MARLRARPGTTAGWSGDGRQANPRSVPRWPRTRSDSTKGAVFAVRVALRREVNPGSAERSILRRMAEYPRSQGSDRL